MSVCRSLGPSPQVHALPELPTSTRAVLPVHARAAVILLGAFCALLFGSAARATAAPAPAPRDALIHARRTVEALAHETSSVLSKVLPPLRKGRCPARVPRLCGSTPATPLPFLRRPGVRQFRGRAGGSAASQAVLRPRGDRRHQVAVGADRQLAVGAIGQAHEATGSCWSRPTASWPPGIGRTPPAGLPPPCTLTPRRGSTRSTRLPSSWRAKRPPVPSSALAAAAQEAVGSRKIASLGLSSTPASSPLMLDGKPEIFFAGSEACPFCAVQRWGLIVRWGNSARSQTFI